MEMDLMVDIARHIARQYPEKSTITRAMYMDILEQYYEVIGNLESDGDYPEALHSLGYNTQLGWKLEVKEFMQLGLIERKIDIDWPKSAAYQAGNGPRSWG